MDSVLLARIASAQQRSIELRARSDELCRRTAALLSEALAELEGLADMEPTANPARAERLRRPSERIGRDPAINRAKQLLQDSYGLNGEQAFELLRRVSNDRNRKVRDVARDILDRAPLTKLGAAGAGNEGDRGWDLGESRRAATPGWAVELAPSRPF